MSDFAGVAQRANGYVCLHLKKGPIPPIPFELQGHISADDWAMRVPALANVARKYYKPLFERIFLVVSILVTLVIPLAAYSAIYQSIFGRNESSGSKAFTARLLSVAIFFAVMALLWTPVFIWKRIGTRRVQALLAAYAAADEKQMPQPYFIPKWSMKTPGIINMDIVLEITTPPVAPVTLFHPDAYLPSFIGRAEEQAQLSGAYFYPYPNATREPGLPRMSVVGRNYVFNKV